MTTERRAWWGPKFIPHLWHDGRLWVRQAEAEVAPAHDKIACACNWKACAFEPLEPKGMTEEERMCCERAIRDGKAHYEWRAGSAALRLASEFAAVTAERDELRAALALLQKSHADAGSEYWRMQKRAERAEKAEENLEADANDR